MRINPKQLEKMARQLGMQMEHIDAEEVIIKTQTKRIVITNPSVEKMNIMGHETYQVTGDVSEEPIESFSEDDVELVVEQTGVSPDEARRVLEETKDIAEAIMKLKKQ